MVQYVISIIITLHSEGIVAHKTLLSIFDNLADLPEGTAYEIVIGADNPTQETSDYLARYKNDDRFKVLKVSFGDPSQNRNNAVQHSSGEYLLLIDGDDLLSPNFLRKAYEIAQKLDKPALIHPKAHLQFGVDEKNSTLWLMENSFSKEEDALIMAYWNRWTNVQFGKREIFKQHPFSPTGNGFGYEDFHFNSETRADGIEHLVAPETIMFYRKKASSIQSQHTAESASVSKTKLLDIDHFKSIDTVKYPEPTKPSQLKNLASGVYKASYLAANHIEPIKNLITPIARRSLYNKKTKLLPDWLIDQWKNINKIENQLYPTIGEIAKLEFHPLSFNQHWTSFGLIYKQLIDQATGQSDYLFLPPEIKVGGTEKLMFNYVQAIHEIHPDWRITIIGKKPPADVYNIPDGIDFIDFDNITKNQSDYEKNILWNRLFIQLGVKRVHIINNKRWLDWARKHQALLGHGYKLFVSLFMREFTHEKDRILTLSDPEIREIHGIITKVFTDNQKVISQVLSNNAFDPSKFIAHYQPESSPLVEPKTINLDKTLKILWASRLSYQKRPDLLKEIAELLDDNIQIDAYGSIEKNQFKKTYFDNSRVSYRGPFSGIGSIPTADYDLYLYTSDTDGIPNILLEISARGLPIIASNVGGISEFIENNKSAILIENDPEKFAEAINSLAKNPERAKKLALNAQTKLNSQHSWTKFTEAIKQDIT